MLISQQRRVASNFRLQHRARHERMKLSSKAEILEIAESDILCLKLVADHVAAIQNWL